MKTKLLFLALITIMLLPGMCACITTTSTTTTGSGYSVSELKYLLIEKYPNLFWCDPDFYPIAQAGQEQQNALEQFPDIRANQAEFHAITKHLNLPDRLDYGVQEKLLIYKEHKILNYGLEITGNSSPYKFTLRTGEGQGLLITGTIINSGIITETNRENSINTCPICLSEGTLIDTPFGAIPVQNIKLGTTIWTRNTAGDRIQVMVLKITKTPVPLDFEMVKVTLHDGRSVTASPEHPDTGGRALGDFRTGDILDGSPIVSIDRVVNSAGFTFDVLPASDTGTYWANGILLRSTLK